MNDQFMNLGGRLLTNKLTLKGFQLSGLKFLHTDCDCRLLRLPGREREKDHGGCNRSKMDTYF